jgi:DNA-binding transcriptional MocR family regulator
MYVITDQTDIKSRDGIDCRNYGGVDGLVECKELFSQMMQVPASSIIVGGNSSLTLMFDYITQCCIKGSGSEPWLKQEKVKVLMPSPGYDRHFGICEYLGIEMITVPMTDEGPDMDILEELVLDSSVKALFCVPKYSNPTGITYSDETVKRLAGMKTGADDFRIIWDNAYCVHDLEGSCDELLNILEECEKAGNPDRTVIFASMSKVTFPGSGIAALASSQENLKAIKKRISMQTIGPDKINQLRHVLFFKDKSIKDHMKECAGFITPRFNVVLDVLQRELEPHGIASFEKPNGGYFISLDTLDGCASRVYELCKEGGVALTPVGATYPYGKDPDDKNIRIAPTYPGVDELSKAMELLCICVKLASIEKIIKEK